MLIDVHVHSKYSKRPSQWILKKIACPESFSEPLQIYRVAKDRGMTHVTITDHNCIDGILEIAHLADTFISEEITTYFPDTGCKIHVLALNISEAQHAEIQKIRPNIYDLAQYLKEQSILNIVAHPLYAINDRLKESHFEQLLLLFQNFELNGARNQRENHCLQEVLASLCQADLDALADKHNLAALYPRAWNKCLWGGSDDHSSLNIARACTQIQGASHPKELGQDARALTTQVVSQSATPLTMAHNLYSIAYQFYRSKLRLERYADKDVLMRFLDRNLRIDVNPNPGLLAKIYLLWQHRRDKGTKAPVSDSLLSLLRHETCKLIKEDPCFYETSEPAQGHGVHEKNWYHFVDRVSQRVMLHFGNHLLDHLSGANLFNIFATIGSAGGLYTLLAPYFVAFSQFSKDRALSDAIHLRFAKSRDGSDDRRHRLRVAHFTDTYYEVNGVALTLQQQVKLALKNKKKYTLITCYKEQGNNVPGVHNFNPIGSYELPEYPEQKINYPPLLEMLDFCYNQDFNHLHSATPGPIGLAALAIAKILKLPISGTYHTAIPQYARILTGDDAIQEITWKYVLWYYDQLDLIYAPSQSTRDELAAKGIAREKIRVYPRGIDTEFFNPAKRNGILKKLFAIDAGLKFIYVGRVSKEKNLHLLGQAFRQLILEGARAHLIVVGDGPFFRTMQAQMQELPCHFTGYLEGEQLAQVHASADVLVFPSTTDTFGNVVLEAQASGLPAIVTDQGGPHENILPDKTGIIIQGNDVHSLTRAMRSFLNDPGLAEKMGRAAREYMEQRSFENAFQETWQMFHCDQQELMAKAG